ncbi:MAG: hypothetical protein ACREMY_27845, partial [bacterium]
MYTSTLRVLDKIDRTQPLLPEERACLRAHTSHLTAMRALLQGKQAFLDNKPETARRLLVTANADLRSFRLRVIILWLGVAPRLLKRFYHLREWVYGR